MSGFHNALRYIFKASKLLKTEELCHKMTISIKFAQKTIHFLMVPLQKYQKIYNWGYFMRPLVVI